MNQASDIPPKIGKPTARALANAGYSNLAQVATLKLSELKKLHGVRPKAVGIFHTAVEEKGLSFRYEK